MSDDVRSEDIKRHETEIAGLRTRMHNFANDLMGVRSAVDNASEQVGQLAARIPADFDKRLITVELQLSRIIKDLENMGIQYIHRTEFEILKVEHTQIKQLVWGFIVMVLTAVVGGLITLIVRR